MSKANRIILRRPNLAKVGIPRHSRHPAGIAQLRFTSERDVNEP
jgi:hypothetical protein